MTLYTVPGTGFAQLIINAGDGPTMVINRDELNQLYIGDDNSVASKNGTGDIDIIDPLSYLVYDGIKPKYAISAVANSPIQVNTIQGATNWAPSPAQAAFQIANSGLALESTQQTVKTNTANVHTDLALGTNKLLDGTTSGPLSTTATNTTGVAKDATLTSGIALPIGAAKDTTVSTVATNTTGVAKDATLTSGIALPIGAAKDSTVSTVNTTLGTPAQTGDVTGISGQAGWPTSGLAKETGGHLANTDTNTGNTHTDLSGSVIPNQSQQIAQTGAGTSGAPLNHPISLNPNPFLTNPVTGNADITNWGCTGGTPATAGQGSANTLPAGSGHANGMKCTPSGASASLNMQEGSGAVPVQVGQTVSMWMMVYIPTAALQYKPAFNWNVNGTFNSLIAGPLITPAVVGWQRITFTTTVPQSLAGLGQVSAFPSCNVSLVAGGNIPAGDICYVASGVVNSNVGTAAGDHAQAIANTGAPLLHGYTNLVGPNQVFTAAAGATVNTGSPIAINHTGYIIELTGTANAASTKPFFNVTVRWYDADASTIIWRTDWIIPSTAAGSTAIYGLGPVRGAFFQLSFQNLDTVNSQSVSVTFASTTQYIPREDWRNGVINNNPPGFTYGASPVITRNQLIADSSISVPSTGGSVTRILPLFAGPVSMFLQFSPTGGIATATLETAETTTILYQQTVLAGQPNSPPPTLITLPREPCIINFINNGTAAMPVTVSATAQEFVS